ncbi:MAG TPA: glycosyltransferase family 4 protein [Gemmatimonadaceae bacterium]|nr:glycosyltransferase family 4 protein [Gemmatimonadaceae bacterium]
MSSVAEARALGPDAQSATGVKRLAIFTSHPIQYQAPLFRTLAASERIAPTVFFGSRHGVDVALDSGFGTAFRWDVPLLEGYEHVFLSNTAKDPNVSRFRGVRLGRPDDVLTPERFDALLVLGWQTLAHVQMVRAAWKAGVPVLVRGESTLQRSPVRGFRGAARRTLWLPARQRLYRAAFERVDAFLVIGSRNQAYYRAFGVPDAKCFWAPYGVDNDWFAMSEPARSLARARVRAQLGVSDDAVVFASSAKLIERKRPFDLLDAVADLRHRGIDAHALFIGDGAERAAIEHRATRSGIEDAVCIAGFVNQQELPAWYAAADALVLPSDGRETWGLVVNEAMAAGLPVVVSDAAGCSVDLVKDGENGYTYACGDVAALASKLGTLVRVGQDGRRAMGQRSRQIVASFGIDVAANATVAAVEAVTARRAR